MTMFLGFDFPGRRSERGFEALFDAEFPFDSAVVPTAAPAAAILERVAGRPTVVVAFCAAAPIAQEAVGDLADNGIEVRGLLLADPSTATADDLQDALRTVFHQVDSSRERCRQTVERLMAAPELADRPDAWREQVRQALHGRVAAEIGGDGGDQLLVNGILRRYMSFVDFLLTARAGTYPRFDGPAVAVYSERVEAQREWPNLSRLRHVTTGIDRDDLLASAEARAHALALADRRTC